jgi:putative ABC transport system permease protein
VIIGKEVPTKFGKNFRLGDVIQTGRQQRVISGIFESDGSSFEGEIWMHRSDMKLDFDIDNISFVTVKLESPSLKKSFIQQVNQNTRLTMADAIGEIEYYASLASTATFVLVMGIIISVFMSLGAIFGGMNIMYLTITARTRELGTLRALGYTPFHILVSLIIESLIIATFGGIIGIFLSIGINGYSLDLFEVAFSIKITPSVIFLGFLVSLLIGFFGGLLPGLSAAKTSIVKALRHV